MKILFACSEYFPLIRTNDVADFAAGLTRTIGQLSHDIRVIIPAYPEAVDAARPLETVATLEFSGCEESVRLLKGKIADQTFPVYLVDAPAMFSRHGHPYKDANGNPRKDNLKRYAMFSQAVVTIALNHAGLSWRPDVVHCNGWQTSLVQALLAQDWNRPATVFTCHELYEENADELTGLAELKLPPVLKNSPNCQVDGRFSLIKAGISYSDAVICNNESFFRQYTNLPIAEDIKSALQSLNERFINITTAIDLGRWNPVSDEYIPQPFDTSTAELKAHNKTALQKRFNLPQAAEPMTITVFDEITEYRDDAERIQTQVLEEMLADGNSQLVICGNGLHPSSVMNELLKSYPQQVAVCMQPSEEDLHYLVAGSDAAIFSNEKILTRLMPDACCRYGTVPVMSSALVNHGGVVDATSENLMRNQANAYLYKSSLVVDMLPVMQRMLKYYQRGGPWWKKFIANIMQYGDNSLQSSIESTHQYLECYQFAIDNPATNPDQK